MERPYAFASWEDTVVSEDWTSLDVTVDESWNRSISLSINDDRIWARNGTASAAVEYVNPGVLAQRTLQAVVGSIYCPSRPGQTSLHARQYTRLFSPVAVGQPLTVKARVIDKFVKRNRQYLVYEAWVLGQDDGTPRMYWRQTRMVAKED